MTIRIFLQSALLKDMAVLNLPAELSEEQLRAACVEALPPEFRSSSLHLIDESDRSGEELLDEEILSAQPGRARRVHIGRCRHVEVKVRYAGRSAERKFSAAATIERVKNWAVRHFHVAGPEANELVLQLAGSDLQPARDKHVGCFAGDGCSVVFDLVRAYTVNGDGTLNAEEQALRDHLRSAPFLSGEDESRWRLREVRWPYVLVDARTYYDQWFTLRLRCDGYPRQAPTGGFWDTASDAPLAAARWPRAQINCGQALRTDWQGGTALYIPCDRQSISGHDQWMQLYPAWLWDPSIGLIRYLTVVSTLLRG
jgi:hypothetical protein